MMKWRDDVSDCQWKLLRNLFCVIRESSQPAIPSDNDRNETCVGKDDIFGEDVKKSYFDETRQAGKSLYTVSTISYCDLHKITIDDLQTIMDAYPEFAGDFLLNFGVTFNLREVLSTFTSRFIFNR